MGCTGTPSGRRPEHPRPRAKRCAAAGSGGRPGQRSRPSPRWPDRPPRTGRPRSGCLAPKSRRSTRSASRAPRRSPPAQSARPGGGRGPGPESGDREDAAAQGRCHSWCIPSHGSLLLVGRRHYDGVVTSRSPLDTTMVRGRSSCPHRVRHPSRDRSALPGPSPWRRCPTSCARTTLPAVGRPARRDAHRGADDAQPGRDGLRHRPAHQLGAQGGVGYGTEDGDASVAVLPCRDRGEPTEFPVPSTLRWAPTPTRSGSRPARRPGSTSRDRWRSTPRATSSRRTTSARRPSRSSRT